MEPGRSRANRWAMGMLWRSSRLTLLSTRRTFGASWTTLGARVSRRCAGSRKSCTRVAFGHLAETRGTQRLSHGCSIDLPTQRTSRLTEGDADAAYHWNAVLCSCSHRGGVGGHGPGYRTRRDRGVDDHAHGMKGCTAFQRVPFGSPGPFLIGNGRPTSKL